MEYENTRIREDEKKDFARSYRDLIVFRRAYALALEMHRISLTFPKIEQYALADQLRRCSKSVCANIAEGFARQRDSKAEWKRFLMIALGSAEEAAMWIDFSKDLGYISVDQADTWQQANSEVIRMLHGLRG